MPAKKKCAKGKRPSKAKSGLCVKKRKANPALNKYRRAAQAEGFLVKGSSFKALPKKGSAAYKRIKARYEASKL
jgi:hypothetical protein